MLESPKRLSLLGTSRLAVGLMQGVLLWFLDQAVFAKEWPATDEALFTPLLTSVLFVPVIAIAGIGNLRTRTLMLWLAGAFVICVGLGWYSIFRQVPVPLDRRIGPYWFNLNSFLIVFFFVFHALVAAADEDRRWIASAATYFYATWKLATQLIFASLFVGLLLSTLSLGTKLFTLINIDSLAVGLNMDLLWIPIAALATSLVFHLIDRRFAAMQGTIKLLLGLISSLLFIIVPFIVVFLITLPFTGLAALWNKGHATSQLIVASAVLIALINSHFQTGESGRLKALIYMRYAAIFLLIPLFTLAAIDSGLQVEQHGWTPSLIVAVACLAVLGCQTLGSALVAIRSGLSLRGLATVNAWTAIVAVVASLALLSPIADPSRLFVADQLKRLETGAVHAASFDYRLLRTRGVGYGWAALERLKTTREGPHASDIASGAEAALNN